MPRLRVGADMPTKIIREPSHIDALAAMLQGRKLPLTVSWVQGASQSDAQRRLSFRWYMDAARQLGDQTAAQVRAECKVVFGAPIVCAGNPEFAAAWNGLRERMSHEKILEFVEATELPVTSIMLAPQMREYMDAVQRHYTPQGIRLTDPEALKYEQEFQ